jgi:hypothetical protein
LYRAVEKMKQATHHLNEQKRYYMRRTFKGWYNFIAVC